MIADMTMLSLFTLFLFSSIVTVDAMRQQSVGIRGTLMCGNKPASQIRVKLFDKDTGMDPDDELDAGYTSETGHFELKGDTRELTPIDPQLKIYHDCYDDKPCQRKWVLDIPNKYITYGPTPKMIMELGTVNLEVEIDGEQRDCIH